MTAAVLPSGAVEEVLERALLRAVSRRQQFCHPEQLLEVLLEDLGETGALRPVVEHLDASPTLPFRPPFAELSRAVRVRTIPAARAAAADEGESRVEPRHLLHALLAPGSAVTEGLRDAVTSRLRSRRLAADGPPSDIEADGLHRSDPATPAGGPGTGPARPGLLTPLGPLPGDDSLVDRDTVLEPLAQALLFGSAVLVGSPGSGRRSAIRLLVRRRRDGLLPEPLCRAPLLDLDVVRLMAGTGYRGELEERVQRVLQDIESHGRPAIVVLEDVHVLVGTGASGGGLDLASSLVGPLRRGTLRILGTTTPDAHREVLERHPALLDQLTAVPVPSPGNAELVGILDGCAARAAEEFDVTLSAEAVAAAARLAVHHLPHLARPGSAVRLIRQASSRHAFERGMAERAPARGLAPYWSMVGQMPGGAAPPIGERHVALALARLHGLPLDHLESGVEARIRGFDAAFRKTLFGQDHVLPALRDALKVALHNLSDPDRPRARLFLLGPPGVGKTECARLLARYLLGREDAIVRLDMSEFQEASSVSTLLGSDKGLVGSDEGGRLTEPLRENPHRVVLLDEIEKAHPNVYHLFLQILDNGEIHDKRGRRVSFRHAMLLFTSNAGAEPGSGLVGASRAEIVTRLSRVFRPEFLNRIERFVPFAALDAAARREVVRAQLGRFAAQLREEYRVELTWDDAVLDAVGDPPAGEVGARHVLRWLHDEVRTRVADVLEEAQRLGRAIQFSVEAGKGLHARATLARGKTGSGTCS